MIVFIIILKNGKNAEYVNINLHINFFDNLDSYTFDHSVGEM